MTDDLKCPKCGAPVQVLGGDRRRPWFYCPGCGWSPDKLLDRAKGRKR